MMNHLEQYGLSQSDGMVLGSTVINFLDANQEIYIPTLLDSKGVSLSRYLKLLVTAKQATLNEDFSLLEKLFQDLNSELYGNWRNLTDAFILGMVSGKEDYDAKYWQKLPLSFFKYLSIHNSLLRDSIFNLTVTHRILALLRFSEDLISQVCKKVYYLSRLTYDGGEWGHQFVPVIKKNQEILGSKQVNIAGLQVAQTVEHWIQDYVGFTQKPDGEREPLDRLNFVNKAPNVKLLTSEERQVLLKLLEVFDWFCDPYVTKEVVEYFEGPVVEAPSHDEIQMGVGGGGQVAEVSLGRQQEETSLPATKATPATDLVSAPRVPLPEAVTSPPYKANISTPGKPLSEAKLPEKSASQLGQSKFNLLDTIDELELPAPPEEALLEAPGKGLEASEEQTSISSQEAVLVKNTGTKQAMFEEKVAIPKGVILPHLVKPIVPSQGKLLKQQVALPKKLNLEILKRDAKNKKLQIQEDIDGKLHTLGEDLEE